jgi:cytochrome P450
MRLEDIPVVSGADWLGHIEELRSDRFGFFERLNRECGDIGRALALGTSFVFANSPELLHEIFVEKARSFGKSPLMRGPLAPIAGKGLLTSEGELWRRQRRLMAPLFTQAQIARYAETMSACARDAAAGLRAGDTVDADQLTTAIAMRIAGKALFDAETLYEADELGEALTIAMRWVNEVAGSIAYAAQLKVSDAVRLATERLPEPARARGIEIAEALIEPIRWPGEETRRLERALATIERHVERMMADRRASGLERDDLLSRLLGAQDEDGGRMSDKQVRDEIITLFAAGHETTATALGWSLYLLARHPEACARVKAEGARFAGRSIGAGDLPALGDCLKVFKEAMRLYPPVYFFGRQAVADVRLGDYDLPAGTPVLFSPYALHRRPELWPDPDRFDPDRFDPAAEQARHRLAWFPFGAGLRTCIGNQFALMEGPIVLATLLGRVDLELASPAPIQPDNGLTLRPKGGIPLRVVRA